MQRRRDRLDEVIKRHVRKTLMEAVGDMEKAFKAYTGSELISMGVDVLRGSVMPNRKYHVGFYRHIGNEMFADAIVRFPDGREAQLMKATDKFGRPK